MRGPQYQVGQAVYAAYWPQTIIDDDGEIKGVQSPKIPCVITSAAHNFEIDIERAPGRFWPTTHTQGRRGWFYSVTIDQEEFDLMYRDNEDVAAVPWLPGRNEVFREYQITGERVEF